MTGLVPARVAQGWAALIVGGGALVIGLIALLVGIRHLITARPIPARTIEQLQQDVELVNFFAEATR